jgi:HAD superfamily hydrolase (TIGR01549 family)
MSIKFSGPKRPETKPDCVLFDIDDTMYAYAPAHEAGLAAVKAKARAALGVTEEQFDETFAEARAAVKSQLKNTASSHSRLLYFHRFLEMIGLKAQLQYALDFEQTYWRTFLANAEVFEGLVEFLDDLRLQRVRAAVVTDLTAQIQFRKLLYFDVEPYFDAIVTSEEAGANKPDRRIFDLAIEKLGNMDGDIWMIGDNPSKDVVGAREALGAITFQKVHKGVKIGTGDETPDVQFSSYAELSHLISSLD